MKRYVFIAVFTAVGVALNYFCSYLAGLVAFPLYLDSVMTIAVTAVCGVVPGFVCAVASNALLYFFANTGILFTACHVSTVVVAGIVFYRERKRAEENRGGGFRGGFRNEFRTDFRDAFRGGGSVLYSTESFMWIGFIAALTNSVLGDTISYFFYSANTTIPQVDNAVQGIYVVTKNLSFAAYFGGTVTNLVDKIFSATVSLFVYQGARRVVREIW